MRLQRSPTLRQNSCLVIPGLQWLLKVRDVKLRNDTSVETSGVKRFRP